MSKKDSRKPTPPSKDQFSLPEIELGDESVVNFGELDLSAEGSSIPLAEVPEPPSGQSLTSWTEVIRRQRSANQGLPPEAESVEVDAPSDRDLLNRMVESGLDLNSLPGGKHTGDTSEIPQAELPVFLATPASESEIDLGAMPPIRSGITGSDIRFDVAFPPSDAGGAMPIPHADDIPLSGVDFQPLAQFNRSDDEEIPLDEVPTGQGISGVDLGASSVGNETGRSSILDVLLQDSAIAADPSEGSALLDYGDERLPPLPPSKLTDGRGSRQGSVPTKPGIDLREESHSSSPEDDLSLTGPDSAYGTDEAIDLYAQSAAPPSVSDSGTLEIADEVVEESQRRSELLESSSIDMNSRPSYGESDFNVDMQGAPQALAGGDSESEIDLDLPPIEDEGNSSVIVSRAKLQEGEEAVAAQFATRRKRNGNDDSARSEIVPNRTDVPENKRRGYLLHGGVLGLFLGAGTVLAAYFGGALPDRKPAESPPPSDNSAAVAQLRDEANAAQKQAADSKAGLNNLRKSLADAGLDPDKPGEEITSLRNAVTQGESRVKQLTDDAAAFNEKLLAAKKAETDAKATAETATKGLADAEKATAEAKKQLNDAMKTAETAKAEVTTATKAADLAKGESLVAKKAADEAKAEAAISKKAVDDAKAQVVAIKKASDEAMDAITKSIRAAGIDPAKIDEGVKKLVDARTTAEAKEKDASVKLAEAVKKETEATKLVEVSKKAAEDAAKARDAIDATLKAVSDRLAKAKFVGDKADSAAVLKGVEDAIKATASDNSMALRDELVKIRAAEAKLKLDLAAAREKETEAAKLAVATQAEAKRLQDAMKTLETRSTTEAAKIRAELVNLAKEATDAKLKAETAVKDAEIAKASTERLIADASRMKADNERLSKDLAAVRELADLIKLPANSTASAAKPDPAKLGERLFSDGLRAFYGARYSEAEVAFRKAVQFKPDDARYHYLHGLALWMTGETKSADLSFEKGRDLERESRPPSRVVSAVLERIQGPGRQALNAYRP